MPRYRRVVSRGPAFFDYPEWQAGYEFEGGDENYGGLVREESTGKLHLRSSLEIVSAGTGARSPSGRDVSR